MLVKVVVLYNYKSYELIRNYKTWCQFSLLFQMLILCYYYYSIDIEIDKGKRMRSQRINEGSWRIGRNAGGWRGEEMEEVGF